MDPMKSRVLFLLPLFALSAALILFGQQAVKNYVPVTKQMLENPSPNDWLMYSRTYDAQRYSPLTQINKQNVSQLALAWTRGFGNGVTETIPLVHNGVMYLITLGLIQLLLPRLERVSI